MEAPHGDAWTSAAHKLKDHGLSILRKNQGGLTGAQDGARARMLPSRFVNASLGPIARGQHGLVRWALRGVQRAWAAELPEDRTLRFTLERL